MHLWVRIGDGVMVPMLTIDEFVAERNAGWSPLVIANGEFFVYDSVQYDPPSVTVDGRPLDAERC
jgi:hypothetical protein